MKSLIVNSPATLLAIITAALISLGLVMVYSSSGALAGLETRKAVAAQAELPVEQFEFHHADSYFKRQAVWTCAGVVLLIGMMKLPAEKLEKYAPYILIASLLMLIMVIATPLGVTSRGARRWLRLGPITIQPSEFAKIALVLFMARFLSIKREDIRDWKRGFLPSVGIWAAFAGLIVLERDLGTIILMGSVMLGMWCLARVRVSHLASLVLVSLPLLVYMIFQHSYRIYRILAFLNPDEYALTHGYQLHQSLIAIGSGGLWGRGLGVGLQKYHFLSEAHTDFIFANVCEELGMLGAVCVVLLFLSFALIGFWVSYKAPDYFGGLVAAGLTMTITSAAFINFFVVLGMAPTKGLALPFFTYGGSSMVSSMIAVGLLINIANYTTVSLGGES